MKAAYVRSSADTPTRSSGTTRCLAALLLLVVAAGGARAEEAQAGADSVWTHKLIGGLSLTQVALKDWAGGGDDALAWAVNISGQSDYKSEAYAWATQYGLGFGQTKLGDAGIRKTDDKIDLSTTLTYLMGVYINPYVAATLKTQFAKGYDYASAPKRAVSQLFDPAYLTQTAGVGYEPYAQAKTRVGVGLREVITRDFNSYADDPETASKIEKIRVDAGAESVTEVGWKLADNVLLTSKLEIFAPVSDLERTSIRNDTSINLKVNRYVSTNLNLQLVKDKAAHDNLQVKEALAVGLSYAFL